MQLNWGCVYRDRVDEATAGTTVLAFYCERYPHTNAEGWQRRIATGIIRLDGLPTEPGILLGRGQVLSYHRPPWLEPPVPLTFETIYEDGDVLVIDKPSGLPVQPGGGFLEHTLVAQLKRRFPNELPAPIHRLGRGTSGLLLLARTRAARANLSAQLRERRMVKVYRALVVGHPLPDPFRITQPIGPIAHPQLGYLHAASAAGLPSRSDGRVLRRDAETSLVEVTITTGRPHQIRIHLAWLGHPLFGDPLYGIGGLPLTCEPAPDGRVPVPGDCGYLLHATTLEFTHPSEGHRIILHSPPPPALDGPVQPGNP